MRLCCQKTWAHTAVTGQLEKKNNKQTNAEIHMLIKANGKLHDIVIYTDSSVTRYQSGCEFTVRQG